MSLFNPTPVAKKFLTPAGYADITARSVNDPDYMHLNPGAEEEEDYSYVADAAEGFAAGIEGFGRSLLGLVDMVADTDLIPDDITDVENQYFKPKGVLGGLVSGITQFATGFVPGLGVASLLGKAGKAAGILRFTASPVVSKGAKAFTAGAFADFAAFDGHTERLSNLIQDHTDLNLAVTDYLEAEEDDSELEGRLKNVMEGALVGGAVSGVLGIGMASIKHLKALRKFDGSEEALAAAKETQEALDRELVASGKETAEGQKLDNEAAKIIEETDAEDAFLPPDLKGDDAALPAGDQTPITSGPQAIYQNKELVETMMGADSYDELEDVFTEIVPKLMSSTRRTNEQLAAEMIQSMELRGMDPTPLRKAIREGYLDNAGINDMFTYLNAYQNIAFTGSTLSMQRAAALGKELENLRAANADPKQINETIMLISQEQKKLEFFTAKQAQIGTGASDLFRSRQTRNIQDLQEMLSDSRLDVKAEKMVDAFNVQQAIDNDDVLNGALNEIRLTGHDKDAIGLIDDDVPIPATPEEFTRTKGEFDKLVAAREKQKLQLEKQLANKRKRQAKLRDKDPLETDEQYLERVKQADEDLQGKPDVDPSKKVDKDPLIAKMDDDIRTLQEQIKYVDDSLKDEAKIMRLREEEFRLQNETPEQFLRRVEKEQASLQRLADFHEKMKPGNPIIKDLKKSIAGAKSKKAKLARINRALDDARDDLLGGKNIEKSKLDKAAQDPEIQLALDKLASAKAMLKEGNDIDDVIKEIQEFSNLSDRDFINRLDELKARKKLISGSDTKTALEQIQNERREYIRLRKEAIERQGTALTSKKAYQKWLDSRPGDKEKGFNKFMKNLMFAVDQEDPLTALRNIDELSKMSGWQKFGNLSSRLLQRNLIGGGSTISLNVGIPNTMRFMKRLELTFGAAIRRAMGDTEQGVILQEAGKIHQKILHDGRVAVKAASKGARTQTDVVTGGQSAFVEASSNAPLNAMDKNIWGINEDSAMGKAWKWVDSWFNLPFALNAGGDAGNKAFAALPRMRWELSTYVNTNKNWINKPQQVKEAWIEETLSKAISKEGQLYSEARLLSDLGKQARQNILNKGISIKDNQMAIPNELHRLRSEQRANFIGDKDVLDMIGRTKEYVQEITATSPMKSEFINTINRYRAKYPPLNFLVPFVNTPTNVLAFGLKRTPFGAMAELAPLLTGRASKRREMIAKMSPIERAEYTGRIATGTAGGTALIYLAYLNRDRLTGSGPRNPDERKALEATGWKPNSFVVGDEDNPTYLSYQRLDPWATMLGIAADIADHFSSTEDHDPLTMEAVGSLLFTISEGVTDKSFLRGLNNVINMVEQPDVYFAKGVRDIISGLSVPQELAQFKNIGETEQLLRESRTVTDAILRKLPIAEELVPPKRTFLGEAMYKQTPGGLLGLFNPVYISSKKNDSVDKAILELAAGFGMPNPRFTNHVDTDMREFYNAEGRQAYDRYLELTSELEIKGKTLRQALKGLVNSRQYKALTKTFQEAREEGTVIEKDPRVQAINSILGVYRRYARKEMLGEFPELHETINKINRQQKLLMQEASEEMQNPIPNL